MYILSNSCIYYLLLVSFFQTRLVHGVEKKKNDKETELLDKEYGVRYASECEGRYM